MFHPILNLKRSDQFPAISHFFTKSRSFLIKTMNIWGPHFTLALQVSGTELFWYADYSVSNLCALLRLTGIGTHAPALYSVLLSKFCSERCSSKMGIGHLTHSENMLLSSIYWTFTLIDHRFGPLGKWQHILKNWKQSTFYDDNAFKFVILKYN